MGWDLREVGREAREEVPRVGVEAGWAVLLPGREGSAFVPDAKRGYLTRQGFPVRACNARSVGLP